MAEAVKFTSYTNFHNEEKFASGQPKKTRWTSGEVEEIRQSAYAEGVTAGTTSVEAHTAQAIAAAANQIADAANTLLQTLNAEKAQLASNAVSLAHMIAAKLAPALIAAQPSAEIEAIIRDCLVHLNREPHLVIRIPEHLMDGLKNWIDAIALERGLAEKIILLGDPDIPIGDCLIEWADGGISRDTLALEQEIDRVIERYIQSIGGQVSASKTDSSQTQAN